MKQETIQKTRTESDSISIFSEHNDDVRYKTCSYCGQGIIPFKMGVCICGRQVGKIQYIKNPKKYARNYYSYGGSNFD